MRFEQKREFAPITITLETEEERDVLFNLLGRTSGSPAADLLYNMWVALEGADAVRKEMWEGRLTAKEES